MRPLFRGRSTRLVGALAGAVLLAGAGVAWTQRTRIEAWYCVHCLAGADERGREAWAERAAALDEAALPGLLNCLGRNDARASANAAAALARVAKRIARDEARRAALAGELAELFGALSDHGQRGALEVAAALVRPELDVPAPPAVIPPAVRLLGLAGRVRDREVRGQALALAGRLAGPKATQEVLGACRELARQCLRDAEPETRARAVRLAMRREIEMQEHVVPLLNDPAPEVRQAAMLAVGPSSEVLATDDLLRWLHDPDADVRRLCEGALRSRGLHEDHVRLGRLMTDSRAGVRLQVVDCLRESSDLEPGVWLRRLSHDPAPAVRAAAVRAASEQTALDLTDRLEQMAENDPSPTVRQLARHYLDSPDPRR